MTGGWRVAPFLLLIALAVGGALLISGPAELPRPDPTPPPSRRLSPVAPPAAPEPVPDVRSTASLTGVVHGEVASGGWLILTGFGVDLKAYIAEDGSFDFPAVPPRVPLALWIGPDPEGSQVSRVLDGIVLAPRERRRIEVAASCPASIRGRVVDRSGKPLAGVKVAVLHPERDWREVTVPVAAVTGSDGCFFVGFKEGRADIPFRVVLDKVEDGYILAERIVAPPAETGGADVVVTLEKGLEIAGVALGPRGEPLPGATVHILEDYRGDPKVRRPVEGLVTTDAEGRFRDGAYLDSVYRVVVAGELSGARFAVVEDGVHAGDEDVEIRFKGYGSVALAFADARTGEPLEVGRGTLEFVYGIEGEEEWYVPWGDLDGAKEAAFDRLPEGHYRVMTSRPGYESYMSDLLYVTAKEDLGLLRFDLTRR